MFETVLKNGQVFWNNALVLADLAVSDGKIAAIGSGLQGKREIDASDKWVLPGAIDAHTHFSLPFAGAVSADDFYTGSLAGAAGGVTTFIDFTAQEGDEGVMDSLNRRIDEARNLAAIDYSFHACIGKYSKKVEEQMPLLVENGITSLKIFLAYGKTGKMQNDVDLFRILTQCRQLGILVTVHAENGLITDYLTDQAAAAGNLGITSLPTTRPVFTEVEAIRRLASFSQQTQTKVYVVHVTSGEGAQAVHYARKGGVHIAAETCPQYLYLNDSLLTGPDGHYYSCCPPIRPIGQQENIWNMLNKGDIAVVATDHCPFTKADKNTWNGSITTLPMGLPGIETMPQLLLNGVHSEKISLAKAVKAMSENPARIFGMYPQKGSLVPGTDADIMLYNPGWAGVIENSKLHMHTDYSPYENFRCRGRCELTMLRGEVIFDIDQGWLGKKGAGKRVRRHLTDADFF